MTLILALLNIILMGIGIAWLMAIRAPGLSPGVLACACALLTMVLLGDLYYGRLILNLPFAALLGLMLALNAAHLYWSIPWMRRCWASRKRIASTLPPTRDLAILAIGLAILTFYFSRDSQKWGDWDAWAIWNLHAKFLYFDQYWTNLFTEKIAYTHPDYPLMLPSLVAFGWKSTGGVNPLIPAIIAWIQLMLIPTIIFFTLHQKGLRIQAYIVLGLLIVNMSFASQVSAQLADSLVALMILLSFVLYQEACNGKPGLMYILGFFAASAAWVKNEGEMFYIFFAAALFFFNIRNMRAVFKFVLGSLLPLLLLASFKLKYAPPNYLFQDRGWNVIQHLLLQGDRYMLITQRLVKAFVLYYGPMAVLLLLALVYRPHVHRSIGVWVMLGVLGCYFFAYLISPFDLNWHMSTSEDRLMHQLYPAIMYLGLSSLKGFSFKYFDMKVQKQ